LDLSFSEKGINVTFDNVNNSVSYYISSNDRDNNLKDYYDSIVNRTVSIRNAVDTNLRTKYYDNFKNDLVNFRNSIQDFTTLSAFDHIDYTVNNSSYFDNNLKVLNDLITKTSTYDSYEILNYWDNENIETKLQQTLDSALEYISPTIQAISHEIKSIYTQFNNYYEDGAAHYLIQLENNGRDMNLTHERRDMKE
jgi:hypothetical protein